jgi:hypothetical protein
MRGSNDTISVDKKADVDDNRPEVNKSMHQLPILSVEHIPLIDPFLDELQLQTKLLQQILTHLTNL